MESLRETRRIVVSAIVALVAVGCSSPNPPVAETDVVPTSTTAEVVSTWVESPDPTPDFASWVNFCCDGNVPESPVVDAATGTPPLGVYPVSIASFTPAGDMVVSVSRFRSCDDDAFRNDIESGCLDPDPEMPHDAAIDSTSPLEVTVHLDDPTLTVHVIGHACGADGKVQFGDWSGGGSVFRALLDSFDADFTTYLAPLGATYFDASFDLGAHGFPDRFSRTCTDVGLAWSPGLGPSLWIPGTATESGSRPVANYMSGRAIVLEPDSTTLYLYAGYVP